MTILPIIIAPDPRLKVTCNPVEDVNADIVKLLDNMLDTMYAAPGLGLAAPQVNVQKRLLVADVSQDPEHREPLFLINPELLWASEELFKYEEGCLSLPEHYAEVERPAKIEIAYVDRDGKHQEVEAENILSTVIQHEMDHLEGILFVDHISRLKRNLIIRKLQKTKKQEQQKVEVD
ncbi:MAG: peptide deformylase [Pseudomonadota bacterium]|nr:peptide deformylase [Pseudomonadota bacterium]